MKRCHLIEKRLSPSVEKRIKTRKLTGDNPQYGMVMNMRTIKFRGKNLYNNEWIFGDLIQYESGEMAIFSKKLSQYGCEATEMFNRSKVETTTVGQFTGLFDKNGKEIYEGDILHTITFGFEPEEYTAIILYDNCRFQLSNGRNLFYFGQSDLTKMDDTIVIGNIYDNPELIKEE